MNSTTPWQQFLDEKREDVSRYWLTRAEFISVVREVVAHVESPLVGLQFCLSFEAPFNGFEIGISAAGNPDSHTVGLDDSRGGQCRVQWWLKSPISRGTSVRHEALAALLRAWWKPQLRTPSAGLPDLKRHQTGLALADCTVSSQLQRGERPAVLFCDLDNFKQVNETVGQSGGDLVIKQFGALTEESVARFGILLHNGGDELVVLCPSGGAVTALRAAYAMRTAITGYDFKIPSLKISVSCGIASTDSPERWETFEALRNEADSVLKNYAKKPKKGRARFRPSAEQEDTLKLSHVELAELAKCVALSAASISAPFGNVWLDTVSALVVETVGASGSARKDLNSVITDFIAWADATPEAAPTPTGRPPRFLPSSVSIDAKATPLQFAFAVAHGILALRINQEIAQDLLIRYSENGSAASIHSADGQLFWCSQESSQCDKECHVCLPYRKIVAGINTQVATPRAVLIKIGHLTLPVPAHIFSDVIVVDDRPMRGGCLPDFWEVTIARLVVCLFENPNVCALFIMGEQEYGAETVARLRNLDAWPREAEKMAARLSVSTEMLRNAAERLRGKIYFPGSYQALLHILATELDNAPAFVALRGVPPTPAPILHRELRLEGRALRDVDGCRVETIAEAFPVVLEIMRNAKAALITDQAGQMLKELIDFKVHLSDPGRDMIPHYYASQEERMQRYFSSAFADATQFFGKALRENDQFDKVIKHVVGVIKLGDAAFATRRAILVVPPETGMRTEWSPLGLVSIRIIPRFSPRRCELSYSFTWRTVEALVGFPYSLYGSVRFSQELTRGVVDCLPESMKAQVSSGPVSYIAHSLHMFTENFGQAIVRRIVNDATS